ncbi:MAG: hypothetical protein LBI03_01825 [Clostridiales bacterium]|nr:hypothetical protein [Clostridiales bacterium]
MHLITKGSKFIYYAEYWIRSIVGRMAGRNNQDEATSLDASFPGAEDITMADTIEDDNAYVDFNKIDKRDMATILWSEVDKLPDKERQVITMRYKQNMLQHEVAEHFNLTRAGIGYIDLQECNCERPGMYQHL